MILQIVNLLCYCLCIFSSNFKDFEINTTRAITVFKTFIMVLSSVLVYARKLLGIPSNPIKNTEEVDIQ